MHILKKVKGKKIVFSHFLTSSPFSCCSFFSRDPGFCLAALQPWVFFFSISYSTTGFLAISSLSFAKINVFILLLFLNYIFSEYRVFNWQLFYFQHFKDVVPLSLGLSFFFSWEVNHLKTTIIFPSLTKKEVNHHLNDCFLCVIFRF